MLVKPKYVTDVNEKRRLGKHVLISNLLVQLIALIFNNFMVYDLLAGIAFSIMTYIFYKIFSNAIPVITEYGVKKAYSVEEVIGASLLLAVAVTSFGDFRLLGFSIQNILSIFIVWVLGWQNGIVVGATGGVTIGTILAICTGAQPIIIAAFALSGLIAGILNKFGKIGVVVGFILGTLLVGTITTGNTTEIIIIKEILIASIGLLAMPARAKINIDDLYGTKDLLPEGPEMGIEGSSETIGKLNSMSETISEIARTYKEAATTVVDDEEIEKQELDNKRTFINEIYANIDNLKNNMFYEEMKNENQKMVIDIFNTLIQKEEINKEDLLNIFSKYNNYIIGFDKRHINSQVERDIQEMLFAIRESYKVSNINFIWKKRMDENKKNVSSQLEGVSKAISDLADEISYKDSKKNYQDKIKEIELLLLEKDIKTKRIEIEQENTGRYFVRVYTGICDELDGSKCEIKKIGNIISKVIGEDVVLQSQKCGLRINDDTCIFEYMSKDKFSLQIGISKTKKDGEIVSGDTSIQTKLKDGKVLLAISDGMGSGPEARKQSKIAIKMLERLLVAGFEKDVSLKLINGALSAASQEDMYATLDIAILDLYAGNMEFIKNGACPTYTKNGREVQLLKSISLPTGVFTDVDLIVYDQDVKKGEIIVMCSDGVIDSCTEYTNRELWLKYLLEDIETDDVQKIADIIISEAIDHSYGLTKDDMTVIVAKVN